MTAGESSPVDVSGIDPLVDLTTPQTNPASFSSSHDSTHHMITRTKSKSLLQPREILNLLAAATLCDIREPKHIKKALSQPYWRRAMEEEMEALSHDRTWQLVPRDSYMNVVGSKWVFKTKLKADGTIDKFKARLVAKGYNQIEGLDFEDTFNPVVKSTTIRIVLTLATVQKWPLRQLYVKNAFLHG
ncbi:uncharacterized mitochondrial protein AtMg00820-like [Nicotiana tomentosiformis]|uniref:uncharacterized mitochondrial protein AtMg00820-like n=1 Tax=Nicotiana tomentosiformis TaxID=4098 RepID=UPI00388CC2FE